MLAGRRIGPYEVVRELGRGGMGVVLEAVDPKGEPVALKVLLEAHDAPDALARFQTECRAASRLQHPNLVRVRDAGVETGGRPYLVQDLIRGDSLQERLESGGPFEPREAAGLITALARAVAYTHDQGVLHRDLKPANVLMVGDRPLLTDFGLACDPLREKARLTRTGTMLGTPEFMSPEQADGRIHDIDARTDVYGLGGTLYALLTAEPPFRGATAVNVVAKVLEQPPRPPSEIQPVDRALEEICLRCLEKDRARRYPSAGDLADALEDYLEADGSALSARGRGQTWIRVFVPVVVVLALAAAVASRPDDPPERTLSEADPASVHSAPAPRRTAEPPEPPGVWIAALRDQAYGRRDLEGAVRRARQVIPLCDSALPETLELQDLGARLEIEAFARARRWAEAEAYLDAQGERPLALSLRGELLLRRHEAVGDDRYGDEALLAQAEAACERSLALDPLDAAGASGLLALCRSLRDQPWKELAERASARRQDQVNAWVARAALLEDRCLGLLDDPDRFAASFAQLVDACRRGLRLDPLSFWLHRALVRSHYRRIEVGDPASRAERLDEALSSVDRSLLLCPDEPDLHCRRAWYLKELGSLRRDRALLLEADGAQSRAVALAPRFSRAFTERGWVRYLLGDEPGAISDLRHAAYDLPDGTGHGPAVLGLVYERTGDRAAAHEAWLECVRQVPYRGDALAKLLADQAETDLDGAVARGRELLEEMPADAFNRILVERAVDQLEARLRAR